MNFIYQLKKSTVNSRLQVIIRHLEFEKVHPSLFTLHTSPFTPPHSPNPAFHSPKPKKHEKTCEQRKKFYTFKPILKTHAYENQYITQHTTKKHT